MVNVHDYMASGSVHHQQSYGNVGPFDSAVEDWTSYEDRLDYLTANGITDNEKKQAIFLTTCGATTYKLIRCLTAPKKPSEVSIAELMKLAASHFHPQPSLAIQHFRFNSRMHQAGKSVAVYLAKLKRSFEHCKFGNTLEDTLRDRIVYGIQDQRTQRRLLAEHELTLKKAFEVAQAIESADTQVQELQHPHTAALHAIGSQSRPF